MLTTIGEYDPRPYDEVPDRARYKDFARFGVTGDTRPDMNRGTADVVAEQLTFASVQANPNFESETFDDLRDAARATNGPCRSIDRREKTITAATPLGTPEPRKFFSHRRPIGRQKIAPPGIAEFKRQLRGVDYVGKEHRHQDSIGFDCRPDAGEKLFDRIDDCVAIAHERYMIVPGQFDQFGATDVLG
jgi:hypothetical protein